MSLSTALLRRGRFAAMLASGAFSLSALSGGSAGAANVAAGSKMPAMSTLVQTKSGPVTGVVSGNELEYLGIPYAAPPVGALRWKPPAPVAPWRSPLAATHF